MSTIASATNTPFTPAIGSFAIQCTDGEARLDRRNTSSAPWTTVGYLAIDDSFIVENPVAGTQFRFVVVSGSPVVQADQ